MTESKLTVTNRPRGIFEEEDSLELEEKEQARQEKNLDDALAGVMSSEQGRRAMAWILSLTGEEDSTTDMDPMKMMCRSARRDVGLLIRTRLMNCNLKNELRLMKDEEDDRRGRCNDN